jgi:hypothetical protein
MSKVNQVGQFVLGMLISLVLSAVAVPLGFVVAFFFFFLGPGEPFGPTAAILAPAVMAIAWWLANGNRARLIGAAAFFPCAGLALYAGYQLTIGRELTAERAAAQLDFSSRTIAQPLGTIDVLGIPLVRSPCIDACARILLNGVAKEVAGVSYDEAVELQNGLGRGKDGAPWIFRRYRLGRGAECGDPPLVVDGQSFAWTGADVQWIQSHGIFDVCILMTLGGPGLGTMILIDYGSKAWRPHGPRLGSAEGAAVASRIVDGERHEIARWEFGVFVRTRLQAPGQRFTLWDFAKALSGRGETDRLADPFAIGLNAALDRITAAVETMPSIDGWAPFEFLRKVHEAEMGRDKRRPTPDPSDTARLRQIPARICPAQNRRLVPRQCFERYNEVVGVIFTPEAAAELRWPL